MPSYQRQAEPSKGNFLSWDAGESKDLVVLSEEGTESHTHWIDNEARECKGEGCALCAEGVKQSLRWTVQTRCEGEEIPWEMSNQCFFGVEDVATMVGHLKGLSLRVTRYGTGLKTRYSVLPITGEAARPDTDLEEQKLAQEIREFCSIAGLDPGQELKLFLSEIAPGVAKMSQIAQMRAFFAYISEKTKEFQKTNEPPPDEPQDIGRYF